MSKQQHWFAAFRDNVKDIRPAEGPKPITWASKRDGNDDDGYELPGQEGPEFVLRGTDADDPGGWNVYDKDALRTNNIVILDGGPF